MVIYWRLDKLCGCEAVRLPPRELRRKLSDESNAIGNNFPSEKQTGFLSGIFNVSGH